MRRRSFLVTPFLAQASLASQPASLHGWVSRRPRLFYDDRRIAQLRTQIRPGRPLAAQWNAILQKANGQLQEALVEESAAQQGAGDDANFRRPALQIESMSLTLGLAFHLTRDPKYAEKLRQTLLHFAQYQSWHGPGFPRRVPPWHSELNTARLCVGNGIAFDAVYPLLSESDRTTIRQALIEKGILPTFEDWLSPQTRIHALDSMGRNWWPVCVSSAGIAALSLLGDDPRAPQWLSEVQDALTQWFAFGGSVLLNKTANFDPKGAFYESVTYANYALFEYLRFRLAAGNVFPRLRLPEYNGLAGAFPYFLHTFYPASTTNLAVAFGDSPLHSDHYQTFRLLLENGFHHPTAGWYLSKTEPEAADVLNFLARAPVPPPRPPDLPHSILYSGIGWAMLRDSWNDDATLLAIKSGFTWNHAHADAGSFTLYHRGQPLIIDSGSCDYGDPAYTSYYVQSRAHNVILFNGQGEAPTDHLHAVKFPGELHSLVDGLGIKYLYADATGPMARWCKRNYRHWLWIDGVIVIFDDVATHQKGTFEWLLHYQGQMDSREQVFSLQNGEAQADFLFLYPPGLIGKQEMGLAVHQPSKKIPYLSFATSSPNAVEKFITVVIPRGASQPPGIQLLTGSDFLGVRIESSNTISNVYFNLQADGRRMHHNSNNTIEGVETDAYIFAWSRPAAQRDNPAAATRFFISYGSYLRRQNQVYFDSLSKATLVWDPVTQKKIVGNRQQVSHMSFS